MVYLLQHRGAMCALSVLITNYKLHRRGNLFMVGAEPARTWEQKWALNRLQLVTTFLRRRDDTFVAFVFFFFFSFWTRRYDDAPWKRWRKREWLSEVRINCAICFRLLSVRQSSIATLAMYT